MKINNITITTGSLEIRYSLTSQRNVPQALLATAKDDVVDVLGSTSETAKPATVVEA
jgi:hypothetical protein